MRTSVLLAVSVPALFLACGGSDSGTSSPTRPDASTTVDAGATDTGTPDADAESAPLIGQVLECGVAGKVGGLAGSSAPSRLLRHDLDLKRFPDALCNDGTGAAFYYRPAATPAGADKWVIQLQGGGACATPDSCAQRWCQIETNFSKTSMSTEPAPKAIDGDGILARPADVPTASKNVLADYNHVHVKYCSSDTWTGTARDALADAKHPKTGAPIRYRIHFLGQRILEATLATLRQESGIPALDYQGKAMPDLDQASYVLLAGASAGGAGVANQLDRVAKSLASTNASVVVHGLADSIFAPSYDLVDVSASKECAGNPTACTSDGLRQLNDKAQALVWHGSHDDSCLAKHATDAWRCSEVTHLLQHHVTTPVFVRMGLSDSLISDPFVQNGYKTLQGAPVTLLLFGQAVRAQLLDLPKAASKGEEATAYTKAPGAYGPACSQHETLSNNVATYGVSIENATVPTNFFDVFESWRTNGATQVLATSSTTDTVCGQ